MPPVGFSTGAIANGDVNRALSILQPVKTATAVELSALRQEELPKLVSILDELRVEERYDYISVHIPSRFDVGAERQIVSALEKHIAPRGWPMIVHPNVIREPGPWRNFGSLICVENMDIRKRGAGQTADELRKWFDWLPEARFCFDIGHAHQVDTSLLEAWRLVKAYGDRLQQIHLSHVNFESGHERISLSVWEAFKSLYPAILELRRDVPIILESTCTTPDAVRREVDFVDRELRAAA